MGQHNRHTGAITITPPLTWAEIKDGPAVSDVRLRTPQTVIDTDDGQITTITGDAIVPLEMGSYSGYSVAADIQTIVDHYGPLGHAFAGHIERQLETGLVEPGQMDRKRYVVVDGRVETVEPRLVWPGDEQDAASVRGQIAAEVEAHAESIGWYEGGGVWADALDVIRRKPWTLPETDGER